MTNKTITLTTMPGYEDGDFTQVEVVVARAEFEELVAEQSEKVQAGGKWFLENPGDPVEYHARVVAYFNAADDGMYMNLTALSRADYWSELVAKESLELMTTNRLSEYVDVDEVQEILNAYTQAN